MNTSSPIVFVVLVVIGVVIAIFLLPPTGKLELKAVPGN